MASLAGVAAGLGEGNAVPRTLRHGAGSGAKRVDQQSLFAMVLCDSLLTSHKRFGIKAHQLEDDGARMRACLCIASGGALIMPGGGRRHDSAIGLAVRALDGGDAASHRQRALDPVVRIVVLRAEMSTSMCRGGNEQFPRVVQDRARSPLVSAAETRWTICDLEDVVQQRPGRRRLPELEPCPLRHPKGIYGDPGDALHFRGDIAVAAGDELLKAVRRTALARYGADLDPGSSLLLVLAAGWNADGGAFCAVDEQGHAWRKAEIVSTEELCALNGHRLSALLEKMRELLRRADGSHAGFVRQPIGAVSALPAERRAPPRRGGALRLEARGVAASAPYGAAPAARGRGAPSPQQQVSRLDKEAAAFLAEMMVLPMEVAVRSLEAAGGDVDAAVDVALAASRRRFSRSLAPCPAAVVDLEADDEVSRWA